VWTQVNSSFRSCADGSVIANHGGRHELYTAEIHDKPLGRVFGVLADIQKRIADLLYPTFIQNLDVREVHDDLVRGFAELQ
jgi:hypothetical protein